MHLEWRALPDTELPGQPISVSIGVSCAPLLADSIKDLIETADQAMYLAKQAGRNQVVVYGGDGLPQHEMKGFVERKQ
jgi:diguanylate cyclase (GGDEF)-like protein